MIRRLLVANRGEIALRIARGARDLGISPVGVYSDADERALFREALDASLRIGPGPAAQSYLDAAAIVAAAGALGADAIHPGYGFLSERAPFAQAVIDAGLIFVGPTPAAIAAMGSKREAKERVRAAGVPVIDGYDGADQDDAVLLREAHALGVPLVIKAIAGGGGRGMRVVTDLAHFTEALASARRESLAAFGDDAVLLERYLAEPRHIEFQILADTYGTTVHLGERDCSIQRRHQKVVEEAPSPALAPELRERMGAAAIAAARSVDYTNAGTVEFLLANDGTFAFLEMNARLQVEHPVTELVYGVDLVHEQLRVASGERLRFTQADLVPHGAAIEVRLNAEDPLHDFAPQSGTLATFDVPAGAGVRVDTGVRSGSDVPMFYDSLLAKIIVHGADRARALDRLRATLAHTQAGGIATNLGALRAIANDDAFASGATTTHFLDERAGSLNAYQTQLRTDAVSAAAGVLLREGYGWRPGGIGIPLDLICEGVRFTLTATRTPDGWLLSETALAVSPRAESRGSRNREPWWLSLDSARGDSARCTADGVDVIVADTLMHVGFAPPPSAIATRTGARASSGNVTAPMPGKIVSVAVKPGDTVMMHDLLVILEAMKMEHRIDAPLAGTVGSVHVAPGDLVAAGAPLIDIGS